MSYDPRSTELLTPDPISGELTQIIEQVQVWKRLKLGDDVTTDQTALQDIGTLGFPPLANTDYHIDATLLVRSTSALVGPAISWAGPSGITDAAAMIEGPVAATTYATRAVTGIGGLALSLATLPSANESYLVRLRGVVRVGPNPGVGNIRLQLASTLVGTPVTCKSGSVLIYRTI